jgi:hypothetical protein
MTTLLGMDLYTDDEELKHACSQTGVEAATPEVLGMRWPGLIETVVRCKAELEGRQLRPTEVFYRNGSVYCVTAPEFGRQVSERVPIVQKLPGR